MSQLKRHWFWILSGVLVLASGACYALVALPKAAENATGLEALGQKRGELERWINAPATLPRKEEAEGHTRHAETLRQELEKCRSQLRHPERWKGEWGPPKFQAFLASPATFKAEYTDRIKRLLKEDKNRDSGFANADFLMTPSAIYRNADIPGIPSPDQIQREGKRLMIELELVRVLNEARALRLKSLRFDGGGEGDAVRLRPALNDPQRITYPFLLSVDIAMKDLPRLLDRLIASSFNLTVSSLLLEKLKGGERDELVDRRLLPEELRNEAVRVVLGCEATEFLFGAPPMGVAP